jgi:hypothetical protein
MLYGVKKKTYCELAQVSPLQWCHSTAELQSDTIDFHEMWLKHLVYCLRNDAVSTSENIASVAKRMSDELERIWKEVVKILSRGNGEAPQSGQSVSRPGY